MNVAKHIKRARKAKGYRPAQLAKLLGVSRSTVHAWEHGGPGPRLDDLPKIASTLDVAVSDLIGEGKAA